MSGEHGHPEYVTLVEYESLLDRVTALEARPEHAHPYAPLEHAHASEPDPEPEPDPGPPVPDGLASGAISLQQAIDQAASGSVIGVPASRSYTPIRVTKPIGLVGVGGLARIAGSGDVVLVRGVTGFSASAIRAAGGNRGWVLDNCAEALLDGVEAEDLGYAGIMVLSGLRGRISNAKVSRVAVGRPNGTNAYGIAITRTGGPQPTDWLVEGCAVTDVPTWIGLDTHGGRRVRFVDNVIRGCRRGIWLVDDGQGVHRAVECEATGNDLATFGTYDPSGITTYRSDNCRVTGNTIRGLIASRAVRDLGGSTGLVNAPNTVVP